jgi:SAM-dependent methyltransferase
MSEGDLYLLGGSAAEEARLQRQAEELEGEARWLLGQLSLRPGMRAIDLGCGPRGIVDLLAEAVGPTGAVVGLERREQAVASARRFVADRGLANVRIVEGDAKATGLPRASFDVVHARLVLCNVPEPERVVEEMVALARPGGMVASYEADYVSHVCDPPSAAWSRLFDVFESYSRANGIDLYVGRKTHRLLRDAGLVAVQVKPVVHVYPHGHGRRRIFRDFVANVRDDVVARGMIGPGEIDALLAELDRRLDDPATLITSHVFFQAWGRKPER